MDVLQKRGKVLRWGAYGRSIVAASNQSVYLPYLIPGESIVFETKTDSEFSTHHLVLITDPSEYRRSEDCPQAKACPGCQFRQLLYEKQLDRHEERTRYIFRKEMSLDLEVPVLVHGHKSELNYRRRSRLRILFLEESIFIGMYSSNHSEFLDMTSCPNHHPDLNRILKEIRDHLKRLRSLVKASLNHQLIQIELASDQKHRITWILDNEECSRECLRENFNNELFRQYSFLTVTIDPAIQRMREWDAKVLWGSKSIELCMNGSQFFAEPGAWTPVSIGSAEMLWKVLEGKCEQFSPVSIFEIGCGIGLQTLMLTGKANNVFGIDICFPAIKSAQRNLQNKTSNCYVWTARAEHGIRKLARRGRGIQMCILHGMRIPFGERVIQHLNTLNPSQLLLISPSTGAIMKDIHSAQNLGWKIVSIDLLDQIPHTNGVLTVATFIKR